MTQVRWAGCAGGPTLIRMDVLLAHGTGNDFVVVPDLADDLEVSAALARALCDRRTGVGADGVIRLGAPPMDQPGTQVFMDHRNADGTLAEMCGNGVRVVAKLVVDLALVAPTDGVVVVATRAGPRPVRLVARDEAGHVTDVAVDMGVPAFDPATVPFVADADAAADAAADDPAAADAAETARAGAAAVDAGHDALHWVDAGDAPIGPEVVWGLVEAAGQVSPAELQRPAVPVRVVSMGNPHGVLVVPDVATAPVTTLGPWLERHARFPEKANIGFAAVRARDHLDLRVWERGVGETHACGTGACAAVVSLQRAGLLDAEVAVDLPGGRLTIAHDAGGSVTMTGPATLVGQVRLDPSWLAAHDIGPDGRARRPTAPVAARPA